MTHSILNRAAGPFSHSTESNTDNLGQGLRHAGEALAAQLQSSSASQALSAAAFTGLTAGFMSGSSALFRSRPSEAEQSTLLREFSRVLSLSFNLCAQNTGLRLGDVLQQEAAQSSHKTQLELYLSNPSTHQILQICETALLETWSLSRLNEALIRSQYQGVDRQNILNTLRCGVSYLLGNHNAENVAQLRNSYRHFMGQSEDSGASFAQLMLQAYSRNEQSAALNSYLESEGILSGISQSANFAGIVSSLSGRVLSMAVIGMIARGSSSLLIKVGGAMLCGAASSVGQLGFQMYWQLRNNPSRQTLWQTVSQQEWQIKSAVVTGMFCGVSELLGVSLLGTSSSSLINALKTFANFSIFNVSAELASDTLMSRIGMAAAYVRGNEENILGPQTLIGQWLEGAGQEIIGDHTAQAPTVVM